MKKVCQTRVDEILQSPVPAPNKTPCMDTGSMGGIGPSAPLASVLNAPVDLDAYFAVEWDRRQIRNEHFSFDIFDELAGGILTDEEKERVDGLAKAHRLRQGSLGEDQRREMWESLVLDFAWKSSRIEGNRYEHSEAGRLVREGIQSPERSGLDARMILNHVEAMNFIRQNPAPFARPSVEAMENLHEILSGGLGVRPGIRTVRVLVTGTKYMPMGNPAALWGAMENLAELLAKTSHPVERGLFALLLVSAIQPFEDGNKRTGRTLANAILMAEGLCPVSWLSVDVERFKKALLLFYEQSICSCFKELFLEEYKAAVDRCAQGARLA